MTFVAVGTWQCCKILSSLLENTSGSEVTAVRCSLLTSGCKSNANGVFGTTGQVVPTSGQVVETTCECSVVSTTDFYQLSGSVQLQI